MIPKTPISTLYRVRKSFQNIIVYYQHESIAACTRVSLLVQCCVTSGDGWSTHLSSSGMKRGGLFCRCSVSPISLRSSSTQRLIFNSSSRAAYDIIHTCKLLLYSKFISQNILPIFMNYWLFTKLSLRKIPVSNHYCNSRVNWNVTIYKNFSVEIYYHCVYISEKMFVLRNKQ